ncbi:uncharacterized protein STEHIDRAFT_154415 [Stereum hirsutum FP-91666 SS1]|uniref:uncharacterized protein n=1 Tax=Stereum hirsutum (strain FP-91666) TaxID=721885 RepID=UPI00044103A8|nr:uncharacterized protein STEHIDRAFT_154415 [Stereum hirsutum FP-91666 SS1]EIM88689.1 hypothetical protein STEHIDRAFT_154415 [Stereum hirsutum FP-91666 SS1]
MRPFLKRCRQFFSSWGRRLRRGRGIVYSERPGDAPQVELSGLPPGQVDAATVAILNYQQRFVEYQNRGTLHPNILIWAADLSQTASVPSADAASISDDSGYETSSSGAPPLASPSVSEDDGDDDGASSDGPPALETPSTSSSSIPRAF